MEDNATFHVDVVEKILEQHKDEINKAGDQGLPMCMAELKAEEEAKYGEKDSYSPNNLHWDTIKLTFFCWLGLGGDERRRTIFKTLSEIQNDMFPVKEKVYA